MDMSFESRILAYEILSNIIEPEFLPEKSDKEVLMSANTDPIREHPHKRNSGTLPMSEEEIARLKIKEDNRNQELREETAQFLLLNKQKYPSVKDESGTFYLNGYTPKIITSIDELPLTESDLQRLNELKEGEEHSLLTELPHIDLDASVEY